MVSNLFKLVTVDDTVYVQPVILLIVWSVEGGAGLRWNSLSYSMLITGRTLKFAGRLSCMNSVKRVW